MKAFFKNPLALFYAIVVHAALAAVLLVSFDWTPEKTPEIKVVNAVTVDEAKVEKQIKELKEKEVRKKREEEARQQKLEREAQAAEQRRLVEEKRLAEVKSKKEEEQKEREQKRIVEEQRLAELKKQQDVERQKQELLEKKRQELERKRKEEETRLAKAQEEKRQLQEKLKREEEERQRKLEDERRKREQKLLEDALLQEQMQREEEDRRKHMEAEQRLLAMEQEKQIQSVTQKYMSLFIDRISKVWIEPPSYKKGLKCTVFVRLIPGGDVLHVEVIESSGDTFFDRSVETAVRKAVPFPLPPDPDLFESFREWRIIFDPSQKNS